MTVAVPGGTEDPASVRWGAPASVPGCASPAQPLVAFPYSHPEVRTGPGAIVWGAAASCGGGPATMVAPLGADDRPQAPKRAPASDGAPVAPLAGTGTTDGQLMIAGAAGGHAQGTGSPAAAGPEGLLEGRAGAGLRVSGGIGAAGTPVSEASGYIGDAAVASVSRRGRERRIVLSVQRHSVHRPSRRIAFGVGTRPIGELLVTLDFRSDALLVWTQGSDLYAREVDQFAVMGPIQLLGHGGRPTNIQGLISDDYHAIVSWETQTRSGATARTAIHLDISGLHVRFGRGKVISSFADPYGLAPASGSLQLVRLSTERVMMAWSEPHEGVWQVMASGVSLHGGLTGSSMISGSGEQAMLDAFATGPKGEAVAVWSSTPPSSRPATAPGTGEQRALLASVGAFAPEGSEVDFEAPAIVAQAGAIGPPSVAVDPGDGHAVAAWATAAAGGEARIAYSIRG